MCWLEELDTLRPQAVLTSTSRRHAICRGRNAWQLVSRRGSGGRRQRALKLSSSSVSRSDAAGPILLVS